MILKIIGRGIYRISFQRFQRTHQIIISSGTPFKNIFKKLDGKAAKQAIDLLPRWFNEGPPRNN